MTSSLTQCPHCHTSFEVSQEQLSAAKGLVRCGSCLQIFSAEDQQISLKGDGQAKPAGNAQRGTIEKRIESTIESTLESKIEEIEAVVEAVEHATPLLPEEYSETVAPEEYTQFSQTVEEFSLDKLAPDSELDDTFNRDFNPFSTITKPGEEPIKEEALAASLPTSTPANKNQFHHHLEELNEEQPLEAISLDNIAAINEEPVLIQTNVLTKPPSNSPLTTLSLSFAIGFLCITLCCQYIMANIESLASNSLFTPGTGSLCRVFSCPEKKQTDLSNIITDELVVRTHPTINNALQVSFIFRNNASFEQPLPLAELNFSDINNRLLINRLFTPQEYLPEGLQHYTHIPINASIQADFTILNPGSDAINYTLMFRAP